MPIHHHPPPDHPGFPRPTPIHRSPPPQHPGFPHPPPVHHLFPPPGHLDLPLPAHYREKSATPVSSVPTLPEPNGLQGLRAPALRPTGLSPPASSPPLPPGRPQNLRPPNHTSRNPPLPTTLPTTPTELRTPALPPPDTRDQIPPANPLP